MDELNATLRARGIQLPILHVVLPGTPPIAGFATHGSNALALWRTLRDRVEQTRMWPVLLGDRVNVEAHVANRGRRGKGAPSPILQAVQRLDAHPWLQAELDARYEEEDEVSLDDLFGDWPQDTPPNDSFIIPYTYDGSTFVPKPEVFIGLFPTTTSYEVPAFLGYGDWNACPGPEVHCAVLRRWQEEYGAEVVGMAADTVELRVARPPRDRDAALALASEQFAYCSDLVEEAPGALTEHAASLLASSVWSFWWD